VDHEEKFLSARPKWGRDLIRATAPVFRPQDMPFRFDNFSIHQGLAAAFRLKQDARDACWESQVNGGTTLQGTGGVGKLKKIDCFRHNVP
jgi:hypothetical protein